MAAIALTIQRRKQLNAGNDAQATANSNIARHDSSITTSDNQTAVDPNALNPLLLNNNNINSIDSNDVSIQLSGASTAEDTSSKAGDEYVKENMAQQQQYQPLSILGLKNDENKSNKLLSTSSTDPLLQAHQSSDLGDKGPFVAQKPQDETNDNDSEEEELFDLTKYEKYDKEIKIIQSAWRGHATRKRFDEMKELQFFMSATVIRIVLRGEIYHRQKGWNKFCFLMLFTILFMITAYLQILHPMPAPYEVEDVLVSYLNKITYEKNGNSYGIDDVASTTDIGLFIDGMIQTLYSPDPENLEWKSQQCLDVINRGMCNYTIPEWISCINITSRSGYLGNMNRFVFGMVISQKKRKPVECLAHTTASDPYVLAGYNSDSCHGENYFEDIHQLNTSDIPYYATAIDLGVLNTNLFFTRCQWQNRIAMGFASEDTSSLCATFITINKNDQGRYGYSQICFEVTKGGAVYYSEEVSSSLIYDVSTQAAAITFTTFIMTISLWRLTYLIRPQKRKKATIFFVFSNLYYIAICIFYFVIVAEFSQFQPIPMNIEVISMTLLPFIQDVEKIYNMIYLFRVYKALCVFAFLVLLFDILRAMSFHPAIGIVTKTLELASRNLMHFSLVFLIVTIVYSFAGLIFLNTETELGSHNLWDVINALWFVALSDYEYAEVPIENPNSPPARRAISFLYFWSYIFIVGLLLLNILLSIVVDAYITIQEQKEAGNVTLGVRDSSFVCFSIWIQNLRSYWKFKIMICCCKKYAVAKDNIRVENRVKAFTSEFKNGARIRDIRAKLSELFPEGVVRKLTSIMLTVNVEEKQGLKKRRLAAYALKAGDLQLRSLELLEIMRDDQRKLIHETHKISSRHHSEISQVGSIHTTGIKKKYSVQGKIVDKGSLIQ